MEIFGNPSKKLRLDSAQNLNVFDNEDLWGAEEMTAEEFDILETQATQVQRNINRNSPTHVTTIVQDAINYTNETPLLQDNDFKQQQYELEGKIKLLNDSLEKISKDLKDEKLKKEKLLNEKAQEFQEKENILQKEITRLQSILDFKSQEMKAVYDKVHNTQVPLQNKKEILESSITKSKSNFLEKFQFGTNTCTSDSKCVTQPRTDFRKQKLHIDCPGGSTPGSEIVASMLCNRLEIITMTSPFLSDPVQKCTRTKQTDISVASVTQLSYGGCSEEIFNNFNLYLKSHLEYLKNLSTKSPLSVRKKEQYQEKIYSCLKDLVHITSSSQFKDFIQKLHTSVNCSLETEQSENHRSDDITPSTEVLSRRRNPFETFCGLFKSLFCLINPNTYPSSYSSKDKDMELSLAVLLSWATTIPESFLKMYKDVLISPLISCLHSKTCCHMSLKLLTILCTYKQFVPWLIHKNDACLLCNISNLMLKKISVQPLENTNVMLHVEQFFSTVFTVHSLPELSLESVPCLSNVLQGLITALWKFYENFDDNNSDAILVLRSGFSVLHLLSRCIPNFKEKRTNCENVYISLVCRMLTLSKENPLFKDLYDYLHDLWDFQEDTSEFEVDELVEDSVQSSDLPCQSNS